MPIKNINDIINEPLQPLKKRQENYQNSLLDSIVIRKALKKQTPIQKPNPHSTMKEVVPPLTRGDFLNKWQEDRKELNKVREERDKLNAEAIRLRKVVHSPIATWSANYDKAKKENN